MPNKIVPKKSTVAGKIPTTDDLIPGELAINYADRLLFARHPATNAIISLGGGGGGGQTTTDASQITSGTLSDARLSSNVVLSSDSRLTNSRSPTSHKSTHATGGADALTPADIGAVTNGGGASTIAVMTQAAYNGLLVKDNNTIYILT